MAVEKTYDSAADTGPQRYLEKGGILEEVVGGVYPITSVVCNEEYKAKAIYIGK